MYLASEGKTLKVCPRCDYKTHRDTCPVCKIGDNALELSGDQVADEVFAQIEEGKEFTPEELEKLLRGENFEPVLPGQEA